MAIVYSNFFGGAFFGAGFFGPGVDDNAPKPDQTPRGGPGGYASPKHSSLTRTRDLPGMKKMIEDDDERVIRAVTEEFLRKLH